MPHFNDDKKFTFVHIPKCAGNTIKHMLGIIGHDHTGIDNNYNNEYFKFAFVRNPWDRFISAYEYFKGGGWKNMNPDEDLDLDYCNRVNQFSSLKEFAKSLEWIDWLHFKPQFNFITIDNTKDCLDFIGKVENLDNDLRYVCKQIGVVYTELVNVNKTKSKKQHYKSYYDDELKNIVDTTYAKDIEYLGYKFE